MHGVHDDAKDEEIVIAREGVDRVVVYAGADGDEDDVDERVAENLARLDERFGYRGRGEGGKGDGERRRRRYGGVRRDGFTRGEKGERREDGGEHVVGGERRLDVKRRRGGGSTLVVFARSVVFALLEQGEHLPAIFLRVERSVDVRDPVFTPREGGVERVEEQREESVRSDARRESVRRYPQRIAHEDVIQRSTDVFRRQRRRNLPQLCVYVYDAGAERLNRPVRAHRAQRRPQRRRRERPDERPGPSTHLFQIRPEQQHRHRHARARVLNVQ